MSQAIAPVDVFRLNDKAAMECFDDGALVLRLHDRPYFRIEYHRPRYTQLGRTATTVWRASSHSMAKEYHAPEEELLADVCELLAQFFEQGLIDKCPPSQQQVERQYNDAN